MIIRVHSYTASYCTTPNAKWRTRQLQEHRLTKGWQYDMVVTSKRLHPCYSIRHALTLPYQLLPQSVSQRRQDVHGVLIGPTAASSWLQQHGDTMCGVLRWLRDRYGDIPMYCCDEAGAAPSAAAVW